MVNAGDQLLMGVTSGGGVPDSKANVLTFGRDVPRSPRLDQPDFILPPPLRHRDGLTITNPSPYFKDPSRSHSLRGKIILLSDSPCQKTCE